MRTPAIQLAGITHSYGQREAVRNLDLSVFPSEVVGLFGPNGSGKTTTLRIISGLLRPTSGAVSVLGGPVAQALNRMGVVLEQPAFYPRMSALENLQFALAFAGKEVPGVKLQTTLAQVRLGDAKGKVGGFSLGMRQRLALAVAMVKEPAVMLLDEPTNGLDVDGVDVLRSCVQQLKARGTAFLLSTHEWEEAERLVDRVVVLNHGRVICDSGLSELVAAEQRWHIRCEPGAAACLTVLPGVSVLHMHTDGELVISSTELPIKKVVEHLVAAGFTPESVTAFREPLADVYRKLTQGGRT